MATQFKFGACEYDLSSRTYLMGILNTTPDSFSDGGMFVDPDAAVGHALRMVDEGADFIDVGGESTRPGAEPVSEEEEMRRVVPVIERLSKQINIPISIDTYKSNVAAAALQAGATIVNDISGLTFDPQMINVVMKYNATVVIMHIQGTPKEMQSNPRYDDVVAEVKDFLRRQADRASKSGIGQVIIDPGIGFGKKLEHNLTLFRELAQFQDLGYPILIGPSRKSFIGALLNTQVSDRIEGSAAAVTASILNGAAIVRVHDVKEMRRVAIVADAIKRATAR